MSAATGTKDAVSNVAEGSLREANDLVAQTKVKGPLQTLKDEVSRDKRHVGRASSTAGKLLRAGQSGSQLVGVMLTITLAAAIGFVGTKVTAEIDESIDTQAGSNYAQAEDNISAGFADAMGLTDIVFLVLMFGVILGALLAFRSQR